MFQWLTRRLTRRRLMRRGLFPYYSGARERWADPFRVYRLLMNHATVNMETIGPEVDEGKEPATSQLVVALADIFDVKRWDDHDRTGLTDWEILQLMVDLEQFLDELKKTSDPGLTSSPPTESTFSGSPVAPDLTEDFSSDCGPVPNESSSGVASAS